MTRRSFSAEEKATAVGLAMTIGPVRAGKQLGIPVRNVSNWWRSGEFAELKAESRDQVADRLWQAVVVGTEEVLRRMRDPDARLSDVARALEVVASQHALLTGGVTERTEHIETEFAPITTPDIRAEILDWMRLIEGATDDELVEHEARTLQMLGVARNVIEVGGEPDDIEAES